jgi:hypothetical protein
MNIQQKTGTIRAIQPNGGYQSQNGYINTFMMTLQTDEGQITGEIGSKSQNYPMNINDEITVQIKNTTHGVKFKKINPQYQQQGGTQQSQQSGRDYDAENRGKCRTQFIKAAIIAGQLNCRDYAECDMLVQYAMTGIAPPTTRDIGQGQQQEDDIPF